MQYSSYNLDEIINDLKEVTKNDINFITVDGIISHSTNSTRIGDYHPIGKEVCATGQTIEVTSDDSCLLQPGVKPGINSPIIINNNIIGCIGVTGELEEVRQFQAITKKLTERYIQAQLYFQDSSSSKRLNHKIISNIVSGHAIDFYASDLVAKDLVQSKNMYIVALLNIETSAIDSILRTYQTSKLCSCIDDICYFVIDDIFIGQLQLICDKYDGQLIIGKAVTSYNSLHQSYKDLIVAMTSSRLLDQFTNLNQLSINRVISYEYYYNHDEYYYNILNKLMNRYKAKDVTNMLSMYIVYIDNDRSIEKTSSLLHLTKSTIKYQISKLHQIVELEKNIHNNFLIYTAAKIYLLDDYLRG